jgi:hypothetical protein
LIPFKGRLIEDVSEIMQIPDTSVVSSTCGNFSQGHDLMSIGPHRVWKAVRLPILHKRGINSDVRTAYSRITLNRFKEARYWFANFHRTRF